MHDEMKMRKSFEPYFSCHISMMAINITTTIDIRLDRNGIILITSKQKFQQRP